MLFSYTFELLTVRLHGWQRGASILTPCRLTSMLPFLCAPISVASHGLKLRERDYIRTLRPMPHGHAAGRVVVVEPVTMGVEKFPPLVAISLTDRHTDGRLPSALSCCQVHVHSFLGTGLQYFHPIRAGKRKKRTTSVMSQY